MRIDLNCDLGEGVGDDAAILPSLTSTSVACGLHAGGPAVMRRTVDEAARQGVALGAHPGYPDRAGFGRHELPLAAAEVHDLVLFQLGALAAFVRRAGRELQHVKAHGALYHVAGRAPDVADALAAATAAVGSHLILIGAPGSALAAAAARHQLRFAAELFADRHYGEDGRLLPRTDPRAFVDGDDEAIAARAVAMVKEQAIRTAAGTVIAQPGHTLCLHGDDARAAGRARAVRAALGAAGITVAALGAWL
jgi:UPF0271 protein